MPGAASRCIIVDGLKLGAAAHAPNWGDNFVTIFQRIQRNSAVVLAMTGSYNLQLM